MIAGFYGQYFFLSNFYKSNIIYGVYTYPTAEHAYQAAKCFLQEDMYKFMDNKLSPSQAKRLGRKVFIVNNWDSIKLKIMEEIVQNKFSQNIKLREKLVSTYPDMLIECNTWNDTFWGVCNGKGENNLGKILMKVRNIE